MRRALAGRVLASTSVAGTALAGTAGLGLLLGWSVHSRSLLLVLLAATLAAMNGYSKAYSP